VAASHLVRSQRRHVVPSITVGYNPSKEVTKSFSQPLSTQIDISPTPIDQIVYTVGIQPLGAVLAVRSHDIQE
jgi:hypothetical protein